MAMPEAHQRALSLLLEIDYLFGAFTFAFEL